MSDSFRSRNYTALGLLILGKIIGILGVVAGGTGYRTTGAMLLGLYGACVTGAIVLCLSTMKRRERQDSLQKQVLAQMLREGTLDQHLRDLRAERALGEASVREGARQTVLS